MNLVQPSSTVPMQAELQPAITEMASRFAHSERDSIIVAARHALMLRSQHGELATTVDRDIVTASILGELGLDCDAIIAALLRTAAEHYRPDSLAEPKAPETAVEWLAAKFGGEVARLLQNAQKARQIEAFTVAEGQIGEIHAARLERLRKMLLAMAEDIRVVFILLAERVSRMRTLSSETSEVQHRVARDTMDLFAPLANRLGVWQLKWELEDLSFRYLEPDRYKHIARLLDEKRVEREKFISRVMEQLQQAIRAADIQAEVSGRPKHIFSIHKKMRKKEVDIEGLYDLRAVRVLVPDVRDCYAVLGLVHDMWEPVINEFDDYIAKPKPNNYRSLHTAVIAEGQTLEVQIRTFEMHQESELGVAAHWRYKEGGKADKAFDAKIAWLRQILDWKSDLAQSGALPDKLKSGLFDESIYVITPQGRIVDLPAGSTPIDFAYHLHTDLGNRCRGAKVDGNIVPLNYKLQNAQTVEILAAKLGGPSRDWLNPEQGYLVSSRALAKVRHWFKQQFIEQEIVAGRSILEKELARLGATGQKLDKLAHELHCHNVDEMMAMIGRGEITPRQIDLVLVPESAAPSEPVAPVTISEQSSTATSSGVLVLGVNNIATILAKCCKPVPPDPIVGFVSKARGVMVHRLDCSNVVELLPLQRERLMPASWGKTAEAPFSADIEVLAVDRQGLLRDVSEAIAREKVNVTAVNTISKNNQASMRFTIEITKLDHLVRILKMVQEVPGVISAIRR
ncbi:MAG TPA: bifunctional (p)ppGpp synthetase/guanosine-3',5'-bis(diphosphate) 3'-pyrophosphohydrolase [Burkholderiales bacterium]|nr:bifunctional (p)ppGpp synthetase/guanosine-3',5'-bis(diphosphate) 3'-pyrophosphohydrolase [Burkholderiales bacterium]